MVLGVVLGSRRHTITLIASALAAVALAAAVAGRGCSVEDDSPEGAARAFVEAADAGDRHAVYQLLGPETRSRLARASQRATDLVGGGTRFDALDLIGLGGAHEPRTLRDVAVNRAETEAAGATVVEVVDASGRKAELHLVEIDGKWRVEIPAFPDPGR